MTAISAIHYPRVPASIRGKENFISGNPFNQCHQRQVSRLKIDISILAA